MSLTTEHSHDIPKNVVLFDFAFLQLTISRNHKKNVIEEANWVGGPFFWWHHVLSDEPMGFWEPMEPKLMTALLHLFSSLKHT